MGFRFKHKFCRPRAAALARFKDRVRVLTRRKAPVSLDQMIADLNPLIRGWGRYFATGDVTDLFRRLDGWIRMRLRSKVIGRKSTGRGQANFPVAAFQRLGLVSLSEIRRVMFSPA